MSDLAKWKLRGPVAMLRTETATWDADRSDWELSPHFTIASFRPDGKPVASDAHNPGGSVAHLQYLYDDEGRLIERHAWMNEESLIRTIYFYDEASRHIRTANLAEDGTQTDLEICTYDAEGIGTKTRFLHGSRAPDGGATSVGYSIEGTDMAIGVPEATAMTTKYAGAGQPAKVILEDAHHNSAREVLFERDASGRLLRVETRLGESPFKDLADHVPPERREQMAAALKKIFGDGFSRTSYVYDAQGRLLQQTRRMGTLKEDRTTYRYDDLHDEPVAEISEDTSRTANLDDDGTIHYKSDKVTIQHNRFEYIYDLHGNWTERIVSCRVEPDANFQRSNIERRTITYHPGTVADTLL